ncbi:MAG: NUDIX hydrolase [Clostridia bacterium]|nr:NUDIX hydrolase [Clostridia bacterium]
MDFHEKTLSKDYKFKGEVVNLRVDTVKTPGGNSATREIVEHPGGVAIVAITDEGNIVMERQYRRPFDDILYEVPAGKLNYGEDPKECGMRELEEETGYKAKSFESLGFIYPSPGFSNETLHLYVAKGLYQGEMHRDKDEYLDVEEAPLQELVDQIIAGTISDAKTVVSLLKVNELIRRNKI